MNALLFPIAFVLSAQPQDDWKTLEATHLKNIKQVTFNFLRAGEGYFSPDGNKVIFQAEEKDTGNPFYQIFVLELATGKFQRISPGVGRTTCGYFRPDGKRVIFDTSNEKRT
jgi:TolB protein